MTIMATETINQYVWNILLLASYFKLTMLYSVYGQTVNPRNRTLTTGGSSGGEGAILAMKGSPLGVGTDVCGFLLCVAFCFPSESNL